MHTLLASVHIQYTMPTKHYYMIILNTKSPKYLSLFCYYNKMRVAWRSCVMLIRISDLQSVSE